MITDYYGDGNRYRGVTSTSGNTRTIVIAGNAVLHDSAEDMTRDISAELRRRGIPHAPAQYDADGNCLTCGEGGRCPGVHTFEEIQRADRAQKGSAT